jgi:outer membrane lipoprotein LolB
MRSRCGQALHAAGVASLLLLSACAALAPQPAGTPVALAPVLPAFAAAGRISVRHGSDALTANFRWRHAVDRDEIDLASPLGQTIARLAGTPDGVELRTADGRVTTDSDWRALTARSLAWPLPVDGLVYWIQGAPHARTPFAVEPATDGLPGLLRQDGWSILYQSFVADPGGGSRPTRMVLTYSDVELRLVVDSWQ